MAKLAPKWKGPAKVLKRLNKVNYQVVMLNDSKHVETFHVEKMKKFYGAV